MCSMQICDWKGSGLQPYHLPMWLSVLLCLWQRMVSSSLWKSWWKWQPHLKQRQCSSTNKPGRALLWLWMPGLTMRLNPCLNLQISSQNNSPSPHLPPRCVYVLLSRYIRFRRNVHYYNHSRDIWIFMWDSEWNWRSFLLFRSVILSCCHDYGGRTCLSWNFLRYYLWCIRRRTGNML